MPPPIVEFRAVFELRLIAEFNDGEVHGLSLAGRQYPPNILTSGRTLTSCEFRIRPVAHEAQRRRSDNAGRPLRPPGVAPLGGLPGCRYRCVHRGHWWQLQPGPGAVWRLL